MVWVSPTKVGGGRVLWDKLKESSFFLLQKHKAHGTSFSSTFTTFRSFKVESAGTFRIITKSYPYYTVAESDTLEEIDEHWQWINNRLEPQLKKIELYRAYLMVLFQENHSHKRYLPLEIEDTFKNFSHSQPSGKDYDSKIIDTTNTTTLGDEETGECIICFENESNTVIISCGHQCLCNICAKELVFKECPICRTSIPEDGIIKVFKC